MKSIPIAVVSAAFLGTVVIMSRATERPRIQSAAPGLPGASATRPASETLLRKEEAVAGKIRAAEENIRRRIGMPAQLEAGTDPARDAEVEHMRETGWLIEAGVEEVEAAIAAAKATPGKQDDVEAMAFAHRASCRFYMEEAEASGDSSGEAGFENTTTEEKHND